MALERIIQCQECGHHEITKAKNTKRCHVCRLDNNLMFVQGRSAKCYRCEARFCPIARDDRLCAKCAFIPATSELVRCVICKESMPSVAHTIAVCYACARDKSHRKKLEAAVFNKVQTLKETDPGPPPVLDAEPELTL